MRQQHQRCAAQGRLLHASRTAATTTTTDAEAASTATTRSFHPRRRHVGGLGDEGSFNIRSGGGGSRDASRRRRACRSSKKKTTTRKRGKGGRRSPGIKAAVSAVCSMATILLVLLVLLPAPATASYGVTIEAGDEECVFLRVPDTPSVVSGNYDLINDEASATVFSAYLALADEPHTQLWKSSRDEQEETFTVEVGAKKHLEFCMELVRDLDDDEVEGEGLDVGFNLYVRSTVERTLPEGEGGPDAQRALELVHDSMELVTQWRTLLDHFDFLRNREAVNDKLTAQIMSRVMGWTVLEAFIVVTMAIAQVWYWKRFFEQRRYL